MSEVKHTPGEWAVAGDRDEDQLCIVQKSTGGIIATVEHTLGYAEADIANAELIVRACNSHEELVEALKKLPLDSFGDDMSRHDAAEFVDHAGDFFEAMIAARSALAKAGRP